MAKAFIQITFFISFLLISNLHYSFSQTEFVQECKDTDGLTSTERLLNCFNIDLPEAKVTCRASGILIELFKKTFKLKAVGNAFFIDEVNREIALFEKSVLNNEEGDESTLDIFIRIPNVSRQNITDLIVRKNIVASRDARVIFVAKIDQGSNRDTYIYDINGIDSETTTSTVFTKLKSLRSVIIDSKKFITADGFIKILFPGPPKKIDSDGNLQDVFSNLPGAITCSCKDCPILHDFDLLNLNNAFDRDIVNAIKIEATNSIFE